MLWREPAGNGDGDAPRKDRVMLLAAPYAMSRAQTVVSSEHRISNVRYAKDGRYALMTLGKRGQNGNGGNRDDLTAYDLTATPPAPFVLKANIESADPLTLPGDPMVTATGNGVVSLIVSSDGSSVYLQGDGFKPSFAPQPFVDRVVIRTGATTRLFEGAADTYRQPAGRPRSRHVAADRVAREQDDGARQLSVDREHEAAGEPDEEQGSLSGDHGRQARRLRVHAPGRREGARPHLAADELSGGRRACRPCSGTIRASSRTSTAYWRGAIRARNTNAYSPLSFLRWSDIWLTQGYALVYPDIPILGKDGNSTTTSVPISSTRSTASIRKLDEMGYIDVNRLGHGGHSYGAFTTATCSRTRRSSRPASPVTAPTTAR